MKILLLGGGLQGLSFAHALYGKHEISCITNNYQCVKSKFFHKVYTQYTSNDDSFLEILEKDYYDLLVPISDMFVSCVSKHKGMIESKYGVKVAVPDYECVYQVEDKSRFMEFCQVNNLPHPKTSNVTILNIDKEAQDISFPALIKPNYSVGARGITRVNSLDELKNKLPSIIHKYGSCTLQELIDNSDYYYNVMMYRNAEGMILASVIIKIVRMYPVKAGSSSCCISVDIPELTAICREALDKLNWIGMADFDVLQRLDDKEFKIIEINPRVPASLKGAEISGVNFPEIIVNDALKLPIREYDYKTGKVLRYMGIDLLWLLKTKRLCRNEPSWWNFLGTEIFYQDIYAEDISTWWSWLADGIRKLNNRNKKLR